MTRTGQGLDILRALKATKFEKKKNNNFKIKFGKSMEKIKKTVL